MGRTDVMSAKRARLLIGGGGLLAVAALLWALRVHEAAPESTTVERPAPAPAEAPVLLGRPAPPPSEPPPAPDVAPRPLVLAGRAIEDVWETPVAGAHVFVAAPDDEGTPATLATDEEGRFRLETVHRDSTLEVAANGFLPWRAHVSSLADPSDVLVRVVEGGTVSGTIVSDLGEPVPGVRVHCYREDNEVYWPHPTGWVARGGLSSGGFAITNERGAFTIGGLEEGAGYDLGGRKEGWSRIEWGRKEPIRAGERGLEVVIRPLGKLLVRYVDAETGRAVTFPAEGPFITFPVNTGPYVWDYPSRRPDGRMVILFAREVRGPTDPSSGIVRLDLSPRCFRRHERADVEVRFLETNEVTVPVRFAEPGPRHEVQFEAVNPDGSPYSGRLHVRASCLYRYAAFGVAFSEGRATAPVTVYAGTWTFTAEGNFDDRTHVCWHPASPSVEVEVGRGHERHVARLQLRGSPYVLTVRNRDGIRVRGYRFGAGRGRRHYGVFVHKPGASEDVVWLPEGPCRIGASLTGVGRAARTLDVPGDGVRREMDLVLDGPAPPRHRGPFVPP